MSEVRIFHDREGQTLTVWFTRTAPSKKLKSVLPARATLRRPHVRLGPQLPLQGNPEAAVNRGPTNSLRSTMTLKRFAFAGLVVSATLVGGTARTQQATKVYRVGALFNRAPNQEDRDVEILKEGLARLGYLEGSDLVIEARFAEGNLNRLPGFAAELVGLGVDVIASYGGPPTRAARAASTSIPIIQQSLPSR